MKKIVTVTEVEGEGMQSLFGSSIVLLCDTYIYTGKLVGINDDCVMLEDAYLIYITGAWDAEKWEDAQKLPGTSWYVQKGKIESFGPGK